MAESGDLSPRQRNLLLIGVAMTTLITGGVYAVFRHHEPKSVASPTVTTATTTSPASTQVVKHKKKKHH